ncbi:MAG: nucleotidyltransferase domain-containing protein, partial [Epsilonproteobacteria bacterium]|nr:nucleotidyltransferase domain-containing protein [Campylobacterota bacterium]
LNSKHRFYGTTKQLSLEELQQAFASQELAYIDIALLFGSCALGTQHARSDYDFAILVKDDNVDEGWGVYAKVWSDIGQKFGLDEVDYDVIDLSQATHEMISSIKKGYKVLKGDQGDISRILGEN